MSRVTLKSLAVVLLLRYGPAKRRPMHWVSVGTSLSVGAWILASLGFSAYLHWIASYASVFGNLTTIVVLTGYIYLSAVAFLAGAQVDAIARRHIDGN